jgi:aminoglycoside phosphotransferase (APT) family kinase protein
MDAAISTESVARYLRRAMPEAEDVRVESLRRILGGASRLTWSCDAAWREDGEERRRGLIFRVNPPASLLPDNDVEHRVYRGLAGSRIPVPEVLWVEEDPAWLGGAFFVMERIDGCETAPQALFREPFEAVGPRIGRRIFEIGGLIAAFDWRAAGFEAFMAPPALDECWRVALDDWAGRVEAARSDAQAITRVAIDWLYRHPPPPAQRVSLVHGDHRNGNVLYDEGGEIRGVLDWEMAHLGDPIEDLAWTCAPNWRWGRDALYAGLVAPEEAIATWEEASGLRFDAESFHWWSLFTAVKAQGIWLTGERSFLDGRTHDLRMPMIAAIFRPREEALMLSLLAERTREAPV